MIRFDKSVLKFLGGKEGKIYFLHLRYVPGPCNDDICSPLLKMELLESADPEDEYVAISETPVKIMVPKSKAKEILKQRGDIIIKADRLKRSLTISGIDYLPLNV